MDTSGFYKLDQDGETIICGPNYVLGPYDHYRLYRNKKDTYTYPTDGWYWFDSEQKAYAFFEKEWTPNAPTMGLLKPWLNETNTENNA